MDLEDQLNQKEIEYLLRLVKEEQHFRASRDVKITRSKVIKLATEALNGSSDVLPLSIRQDKELMNMYNKIKFLKEFLPKKTYEKAVEHAVSSLGTDSSVLSKRLVSIHDKLHLLKSL